MLNIDEVDGIYLASPRGLIGRKTEPPDYILMFCSANVPRITYKIKFDDLCPSLLGKIFESSTKESLGMRTCMACFLERRQDRCAKVNSKQRERVAIAMYASRLAD